MRAATLRRLVGITIVVLFASGCGSGGRPPTLQETFTSPGGLISALSQTPAAGICPEAGRVSVVKVYVGGGTPEPRCLRVGPGQQLEVINMAGRTGSPDKAVTVMWPPFRSRTLEPGQAIVFRENFRSYLATGDHEVGLSRYHGGGPEIWVRR